MNQQKRDLLWLRYHGYVTNLPDFPVLDETTPCMSATQFTAALQEAEAIARRAALEEAAQVCGKRANACYRAYEQSHNVDFLRDGHEAEGCELAILALAAQPQEGV